ncbi:MAG: cysteine peptidase family C39 domain-containing protein [Patescibacteria group bacterium]
MRSVTQQDSYGCSLACISFLVKKEYQQIATLVRKEQAQTKGFTCKELIKILLYFNLDYEYKYLKPRWKSKIYQEGVIVFIKRSKRYPSGHYLIRSNNLWMDPWINFNPQAEIENAKSSFRKRLPGRPIYALFPKNTHK